MTKYKDLTGKQIGKWKVLNRNGSKWDVECTICGKRSTLRKYDIEHSSANCGHTKLNDLSGKQINEWQIIEYVGNGYYKARCSCGVEKNVLGKSIISGASKSCGHSTTGFKDLTNKNIYDWSVIKYNGDLTYTCKCSCGVIRNVRAGDLRSGRSKSCGHDTTAFKDMTGQLINNWKVLMYYGDSKWLCECQCENKTIQIVSGYDLRSGKSKSCGCQSISNQLQTKLTRYGEIDSHKYSNKRSIEQIEILGNKDKLLKLLREYNYDIAPKDVAFKLGVTLSSLLKKIHEYEIEDYIKLYRYSGYEEELHKYIESICNYKIEYHNRKILQGKELDIYIPEKKLAIEFNGNYWHSSDFKDKYYHQEKTIACAKQGIRLIHIFEYEWNNIKLQNKLKNIINMTINNNGDIHYARNCKIIEIDDNTEEEFENAYHIQGYAKSSIKIACIDNTGVLGVMTFGRPRFNNSYQYELIRLCFKENTIVVGGVQKMFKYFLDKYSPQSIITYCDISKFTGNSYLKLGFSPVDNKAITEPNYVWTDGIIVLNRYQTQKSKICSENDSMYTENQLMSKRNFIKIYNSGNIKLEWIER